MREIAPTIRRNPGPDGWVLRRWVAPALVAIVALLIDLLLVSIAQGAMIRVLLLSPVLIAALVTGVETLKRTLVAVVVLEIAIPFDVYLGFDVVQAAGNAVTGYNLSVTSVALIVLYSLWGIETLGGRGFAKRLEFRSVAPALSYAGALLISSLVAENLELVAFEAVLVTQGILILVYMMHFVSSRAELTFIVSLISIALIIQGVFVLGSDGPFAGIDLGPFKGGEVGRVSGTLGHPNALGTYLTLALPPVLAHAMTSASPGARLIAGSGFSLGVVTLVLTQSRGAWIGATVAMAALIFMLRRRGWLAPATVLAMALLGVVVLAALGSTISARAASLENGAALSRVPLMALAVDVIGDHPFLGVGANNFAQVLPSYLTMRYTGEWISTVHNKYLLVWAETGILGLITWLWLVLSAIRAGFKRWAERDRAVSPVALGCGLALVGSMLHATVAIYHGRVHIQMIMLVAGLAIATHRLPRRSPSADLSPEVTAGTSDRLAMQHDPPRN